MEKQDKFLWLVNKDHPFDEKKLEEFELVKFRDSDGKSYCVKEALEALEKLESVMYKKHNLSIFRTSGGRTIATQQKVFDDYRKEHSEEDTLKTVAIPGTSEHHTGLAFDVKPEIAHLPLIQNIVEKLPLPERIAYLKQPDYERKNEMYTLLHQELEDCGFIVRYTKEKEHITGVKPERWHIRYVGVENAKEMNKKGLCLEEYVALKANEQNMQEQLDRLPQ